MFTSYKFPVKRHCSNKTFLDPSQRNLDCHGYKLLSKKYDPSKKKYVTVIKKKTFIKLKKKSSKKTLTKKRIKKLCNKAKKEKKVNNPEDLCLFLGAVEGSTFWRDVSHFVIQSF